MCRNIRVLHNFEPPTTPDEIRAAALQYVRKVSGLAKPPQADVASFDAAVDAVTAATTALLAALTSRGTVAHARRRARQGAAPLADATPVTRRARAPSTAHASLA